MFNFDLSQAIEPFLLKNRQTREYDIIRHLQDQTILPKNVLQNPLSMFRCHFLIFNALYRLQLKTLIHQRYSLDISSLKINVNEFSPDDETLIDNKQVADSVKQHDALSHFYLDLEHLNQTSEQDVNQLIDGFWKHYFNNDQKAHALSVMGLEEPVDFSLIKKQYRRLAMKHHPDRGGDADQLIKIHQAMQCLEMYY